MFKQSLVIGFLMAASLTAAHDLELIETTQPAPVEDIQQLDLVK